MIPFTLFSPSEIAAHIAKKAKEKRLAQNLSQNTLSERSNVSLSVIKKFERTGKISLESLLKLSLVLGSLEDFLLLFKEAPTESYLTLDEMLKPTRKRGRG
jgi:transcriptional regulator with XRE-family HTH domain